MSTNLTPEQREAWLEEVRTAASEGRPPQPMPWAQGPRRPGVPQPQPTSSGIFTSADLTHDLLGAGHEYLVPNSGGKRLFIFAITPDDHAAMLAWSLTPDLMSAEPEKKSEQVLSNVKLGSMLKVAQVVLCTRQGPSRTSPRCFTAADLPAIRSRLGNSTVLEICRLSDELSGNEEVLGASARRFFSAVLNCLRTSPFPVDTSDASQLGWNDTRTRLLSLATRLFSRGSFDSGLMNDLAEMEQGG